MSTRDPADLTDLVYDEMHATRWDLADWELRELAQTAAGVLRARACDHEAQIRDLLEEREELLTEIRRLRMGNHPAGRALVPCPHHPADCDGTACASKRRADALTQVEGSHLALAEALTERDAEHEGGAS